MLKCIATYKQNIPESPSGEGKQEGKERKRKKKRGGGGKREDSLTEISSAILRITEPT